MFDRKQKKQTDSATGSSTAPLLIALAAGIAGFLWWKKKQRENQKSSGNKASGSAFKFPAGKAEQASTSNLPRNKASNNKKNKSKKTKQERQEKQTKYEVYCLQLIA